MARALGDEEFLSADSVDALLDRFLEYEGAQQHETPSKSTCSKLDLAESSHSLLRTAASSVSRKRQSGRSPPPFTASPTKKRCEHSVPVSSPIVAGSAMTEPTLRNLLTGGPDSPTLPVCSKTYNDTHLRSLSLTKTEERKDIITDGTVVSEGDLGAMAAGKAPFLVPHKKPVTIEEDIEQKQSRRVVFLGNLPSTVSDLQIFESFSNFGQIEDISLHSRTAKGMYYAFVTFKDKGSADKAVREGSLPGVPDLDLSYGGRRHFCGQAYIDHDKGHVSFRNHRKAKRRQMSSNSASSAQDFDTLLHEFARKTA